MISRSRKKLVSNLSKVKQIQLEEMTPENVITTLELLYHDFYSFKNIAIENVSVAYLREDGQYGIIKTI